ncbi:hypothetical protein HCB17_26000, partial [Salinispora arenicola]|uniref:hypothetical protein n=1 Tax=Salinispora arenicola TaxID=168697 RepID=UPI001432005B
MPATRLSSSPSSSSVPAGCVPGQGGVPDSIVGELLCGSWGGDATDVAWRLVCDRWPLLLAAARRARRRAGRVGGVA